MQVFFDGQVKKNKTKECGSVNYAEDLQLEVEHSGEHRGCKHKDQPFHVPTLKMPSEVQREYGNGKQIVDGNEYHAK